MGGKGLVATGAPHEPAWLLYIKGAIIFFSLIILALSAFALSRFFYGGAPGFNIFVAILSWIVYGLNIGLSLGANQFYFRIGFFIAEIFLIIFWLSAWAWSATYAAVWAYYRDVGGVMGACAGLGALVWIMVIVDFVFFTIGCVRSENSAPGTTSNVELGHNKENQNVVPPQQQQPYNQAQYAQQPQYAQPAQPGYPQQA